MATVLVRQLDDEVVRRLEQRAAGNNRSLESEVRHILEQAAGDDMGEKTRAFRELSKRLHEQQTGDRPQTPSHILIREDRYSGHGSA
jgi:plasmid stability protein